MLSPKRTKYRKQFKGRIHGVAKGGTTLNFGAFGLKATEPGRIMFELDGVPTQIAREAFELAAAKLSISARIVTRMGEETAA